jgi:hypothetical protein
MLSEARIVSLQAEQVLGDLQRELERYWTSARVAETARLYSIAVHGSDEPDPPASGETREGNAGYWLTALSDVMEVRWLEEARAQRGGRSLTELLVLMHETAVRKACTLLAYQEVITQACALIGIEPPCCWPRVPRELDILFERSDGDDLSAGVREAAGTYNEVVKALDDWRDGFACPQLPPIEIDRLAPDPLTREVLHLRLGHGLGHANLGDDWWVKSY